LHVFSGEMYRYFMICAGRAGDHFVLVWCNSIKFSWRNAWKQYYCLCSQWPLPTKSHFHQICMLYGSPILSKSKATLNGQSETLNVAVQGGLHYYVKKR